MDSSLICNAIFATQFFNDIFLAPNGQESITMADADYITKIVKKFSQWEKENIFTLENKWEDYHEDYESVLYNYIKTGKLPK